jgi:hypothetical protein
MLDFMLAVASINTQTSKDTEMGAFDCPVVAFSIAAAGAGRGRRGPGFTGRASESAVTFRT